MQANDMQVGGSHYSSGYQHWDFVHDALCGLYLEGQITKYVARWRKKNGLQDLEKALHFAMKLAETPGLESIESLNGEQGINGKELATQFCIVNNLGEQESYIITTVATWAYSVDLGHVIQALRDLIDKEVRDTTPPFNA